MLELRSQFAAVPTVQSQPDSSATAEVLASIASLFLSALLQSLTKKAVTKYKRMSAQVFSTALVLGTSTLIWWRWQAQSAQPNYEAIPVRVREQ